MYQLLQFVISHLPNNLPMMIGQVVCHNIHQLGVLPPIVNLEFNLHQAVTELPHRLCTMQTLSTGVEVFHLSLNLRCVFLHSLTVPQLYSWNSILWSWNLQQHLRLKILHLVLPMHFSITLNTRQLSQDILIIRRIDDHIIPRCFSTTLKSVICSTLWPSSAASAALAMVCTFLTFESILISKLQLLLSIPSIFLIEIALNWDIIFTHPVNLYSSKIMLLRS